MNNNESRNYICISCPIGCDIEVSKKDALYIFKNNKCSRGEEYVLEEISNPIRVLTSTVKLRNSSLSRLPVKSDKGILKKDIFKCMKILNKFTIEAPVKCGDVLIENILDTGVDIVSTKSVKRI